MSIRSVLIGGGTGFLGKSLKYKLIQNYGAEVILVSRKPSPGSITWDELNKKGLPPGLDAVINLAGQNVLDPLKRWTPDFQHNVLTSRVDTTARLANLIDTSIHKIRAFVTISGVGIYKPDEEVLYNEKSKCSGFDFFSRLCIKWEKASKVNKCRSINIRSGVVLGRDGGMVKGMYPLFYLGLGAKVGSGKQYMPWIHIDDLCNIFIQSILNEQFSGPINGVASEIITNGKFTKEFAHSLGKPSIFTIPERVVNVIFGPERAVFMTKGQKVASVRMEELDYQLKYPSIQAALDNIVNKK